MERTLKNLQKKMRIMLNNKFYKKQAIEEAIATFKDVCECKIIDNSFEIEIIPKISPVENIDREFCNFVLGITKDKFLF